MGWIISDLGLARELLFQAASEDLTVSEQVSIASDHTPVHGPVASAANPSCVARLAQFFPGASPVRLPVTVAGVSGAEETVLEYGTRSEVLFACRLPRDFGERVRLRNSDGSFEAEAEVVAMQYHAGRIAVAARFTRNVANWIVKS